MSIAPATLRPSQILVRGVNWLGDAVMTTPALLRLRQRFPNARIILLVPEKLRDLWEGHPAVDETITFGAGAGLFAVSRKLREWHFEVALVLPNSTRSALETWLARIPQRIGCARPGRSWLLTTAVPPRVGCLRMQKLSIAAIRKLAAGGTNPQPESANRLGSTQPTAMVGGAHQIHDYLHLVAVLGANPEPLPPRLEVKPAEVEAVARNFSLADPAFNQRPLLAMNPGAEYGPAKRWPVERFVAAACEIQQRTGCRWLLLGGLGEVELASRIAEVVAVHNGPVACKNLAGLTSLRELMALLKSCRALLTNDTGPMHVAAALGTPVVVPFGSTSAELTGPGMPGDPRHHLLSSRAPCSPCFRRTCPIDFRCMTGISVEQVVEALVDLVNR